MFPKDIIQSLLSTPSSPRNTPCQLLKITLLRQLQNHSFTTLFHNSNGMLPTSIPPPPKWLTENKWKFGTTAEWIIWSSWHFKSYMLAFQVAMFRYIGVANVYIKSHFKVYYPKFPQLYFVANFLHTSTIYGNFHFTQGHYSIILYGIRRFAVLYIILYGAPSMFCYLMEG